MVKSELPIFPVTSLCPVSGFGAVEGVTLKVFVVAKVYEESPWNWTCSLVSKSCTKRSMFNIVTGSSVAALMKSTVKLRTSVVLRLTPITSFPNEAVELPKSSSGSPLTSVMVMSASIRVVPLM